MSLHYGRDGLLWVGTRNSIWRHNGRQIEDLATVYKLPPQTVLAIHGQTNGTLWFATRERGLWRFDGRQFSNFNKTNGLPGNWMQSITEAPDGTFWFTTGQTPVEPAQGVVRYDGKQFTTFATTNGLAENYVRVIHCDRDGTVWFGTGAAVFAASVLRRSRKLKSRSRRSLKPKASSDKTPSTLFIGMRPACSGPAPTAVWRASMERPGLPWTSVMAWPAKK